MVCNICGKELDMYEEENTGKIKIPFHYGSKYDGRVMKLSLCSACYDSVADCIINHSKIIPEFEDV